MNARVLAATGVLALFSPSPRVVFAAPQDAAIVVQVDNFADVPREDLAEAESVATRVFEAIGVTSIWIHEEVPFDDPRGLRVHLRLLSRHMADRKISKERIADDVLGEAVQGSRCAYIFVHRIASIAMQELRDYARLLGLSIAHEIGHIVLPTRGHSGSGIMSPHVYLRSKYNLVYFTEPQGDAIRELLLRHSRSGVTLNR